MACSELRKRLAYVVSWFPAVSETFILDEILALENEGLDIQIYPLFGARTNMLHPGADKLVERTRYQARTLLSVVAAQFVWALTSPRRYARAWLRALVGNLRSPAFLARALFVVPLAAAIAWDLRRRGAEHVHAHWATHPTLAALVIHELMEVPFSFTTHAHDLYVDRTMLEEKIRAASFVVTISDFNKRLIEETFGRAAGEKTHVVRCGVDTQFFARRGPGGIVRDQLKLVSVATFRPYKGHTDLVEACAELVRRGFDPQLELIGDGPERRDIEQLVSRLGLSSRVRFLGARARPDVIASIRDASVAVLPSVVAPDGQMEGIPVFLMECLALGVPVVSTRISGIPELVIDAQTGLLVEPGQPSALADAIGRLATDPALGARLVESGRALVEDRYSIAKNASHLARLFRTGGTKAAAVAAPLTTAV